MRLPWFDLESIRRRIPADSVAVLGCLSFEERCTHVPIRLKHAGVETGKIGLIEVLDPADAVPDHRIAAGLKVKVNRDLLSAGGVTVPDWSLRLQASDDELLAGLSGWLRGAGGTVLLDISCFPKRFFCFFLKLLLEAPDVERVLVTCTHPREYLPPGPTPLAGDPMSPDSLPGFSPPLPPQGNTLVISIGFEPLFMRQIIETYGENKRDTKIIMAMPPDIRSVRREWDTLLRICDGEVIDRKNLRVIATWDAEEVYTTLRMWSGDANGLILAPFGPKAHSLGMALFAMKNRRDAGMVYTQPKSYNPDYSVGSGKCWVYVPKWDGICCYDREVQPL